MATLNDLVLAASAALGVPPARTNVLAMGLRKDRLIRSSGRGSTAAEMQADDAANLVIACMSGGYATDAAATTRLVRSATWLGGSRDGEATWDLPDVPCMQGFGQDHTFADALAAVVDDYVQHGRLRSGGAVPYTSLRVSIERTTVRFNARMTFSHGTDEWSVSYSAKLPEISEAPPEQWAHISDEMAELHGGMSYAAGITGRELRKIGARLRDGSAEGPAT